MGNIINIIFMLYILHSAYRGGNVSLKLVKGCTGLLVIFFITVVAIVWISLFMRHSLSENLNWVDILTDFPFYVGFGFSIWALFLSKSVKSFVAYQRKCLFIESLNEIEKPKAEPGAAVNP